MDGLNVKRECVSLGRIAFIYYIEVDGFRVARARVFMVALQNEWAVTGVWVASVYRRCGLATQLLQAITRDADKYGWALRLVPQPDRTTDISKDELARFYERFGFDGVDGMRRAPQVKEMI